MDLITSAHDPTTQAERHALVLRQAEALAQDAPDLIAAMANIAALVHHSFGWHWTGFYRVVGDELRLGPFQGPVACDRIVFGKGVCGSAWAGGRTMVVPDVDLFPGHIACSPLSRSELVVPLKNGTGEVVAVFDIDSAERDAFAPDVVTFTEALVRLLETRLS